MDFRHTKTGHVYRLGGIVLREADLVPLCLYYGSDGTPWTRPAAEFFDGRFEPFLPNPAIKAAAAAGGYVQ